MNHLTYTQEVDEGWITSNLCLTLTEVYEIINEELTVFHICCVPNLSLGRATFDKCASTAVLLVEESVIVLIPKTYPWLVSVVVLHSAWRLEMAVGVCPACFALLRRSYLVTFLICDSAGLLHGREKYLSDEQRMMS